MNLHPTAARWLEVRGAQGHKEAELAFAKVKAAEQGKRATLQQVSVTWLSQIANESPGLESAFAQQVLQFAEQNSMLSLRAERVR